MSIYTEEQVQWALDAAKQDATYLISPNARSRAILILLSEDSPEADAARIILHDGGAQQGIYGHRATAIMSKWVEAATLLGVFND